LVLLELDANFKDKGNYEDADPKQGRLSSSHEEVRQAGPKRREGEPVGRYGPDGIQHRVYRGHTECVVSDPPYSLGAFLVEGIALVDEPKKPEKLINNQ
jgi:hypothetical protein